MARTATDEIVSKSPDSINAQPVKPTNADGKTFYPGKIVAAGTELPDGWVCVQFDGGTLQAWPKADSDFDPELRRKTLSALDKAWADFHLPTQDNPHPKAARLMVNSIFSDLFPNQIRWGDDCAIVTNDNYFTDEEADRQPRFRIEGPQQVEAGRKRR